MCVCVCVCSIYKILAMEPLPPLVACSLQPMCAMGRCRNAQVQEGEPRTTNVRAGQGQMGNVKCQDPWWALWASVADASRPSECHEMQRERGLHSMARWGDTAQWGVRTARVALPSLLPWCFLGISCCSEVLGREKRRYSGVRWLWKHVPQTDLVKLQENKP